MASRDHNICELCNVYVDLASPCCPQCRQRLVSDVVGKVSIWRLGDVRDGVLGPIARDLREAFHLPVAVQAAYLDERLSRRPHWRGLSANVFLDQIHRRHQKGSYVSLGITESNIVPDARHNFLFGYAYLSFPAAVISLHALDADQPTTELLIQRASVIAIHEIGHTLGLDHHAYEDDVDCVMTADEDVDSLEMLDAGTRRFCAGCRKQVALAFVATDAQREEYK